MNLALLNPFRQADRIDSTLSIPRALHPPRPKVENDSRGGAEGADGEGGGGGGGSVKKDKGKKSKAPSAADDDASVMSAKKKKKSPMPSSSSAASTSAEGSGGNPFKIPKKQKLFKQSLKLTKISSQGPTPGGGGEGDDNTNTIPGEKNASSHAADPSPAATEKSITDVTDTNFEKSTDVKMEEVTSSMNKEAIGDNEDVQMEEAATTNITPKPSKKKRKKRTPTSKTTGDARSSDDEESISKTTAANDNNEEEDDPAENYWTACYAVSFNRRGSFLASGHASGLIPVHDFSGRTAAALYRPPPGIGLKEGQKNGSAILKGFVYDDRLSMMAVEGGSNGIGGEEGASGSKKEDKEKKVKPSKKQKKTKSSSEKVEKGSKKKGKSKEGLVKISSSDDLLVGAEAASAAEGTPKKQSSAAADIATADAPTDAINTKEGGADVDGPTSDQQLRYANGVTSLSWDRRSRTLLAGAIGDKNLRLMDNTHPLVSTDCTDAVRKQYLLESGGKDGHNEKNEKNSSTYSRFEDKKDSVIAMSPPVMMTLPSAPLPSQPPGLKRSITSREENIPICLETVSLGRARLLRSNIIVSRSKKSSKLPSVSSTASSLSKGSILKPMADSSVTTSQSSQKPLVIPTRRHPTLLLELPQPLGGPVQLHPRDSHAGLACMIDGSLALFYMPPMAFYETLYSSITMATTGGNKTNTTGKGKNVMTDEMERKKWVVNLLKEEELGRVGNLAYLVPPPQQSSLGSKAKASASSYFITCAAFGKNGDVIWAVTKCGNLLAFRIDSSMMNMLRGQHNNIDGDDTSSSATALANQMVRPTMRVKVPGGAAAWQIIVSHSGKYILINSADCSLRLYHVEELEEAAIKFESKSAKSSYIPRKGGGAMTKSIDVKPRFVFQDNISKAPWASCDFSGDGEYIVGGCNSYPQPGDNYKLFLWNCITGELVDQLTGPMSSLYSLSCHPTRPFIAVGTSDGLVDVWGARLDWVAFAPDFQALQQNELYEEKEDEFDIIVNEYDDNADCGKGGESTVTKDNDRKKGEGSSSSLSVAFRRHSLEEEDVDITTIDKVPAFDSDSEDELDVFYFDTKVDKILSEKQPGPKKVDHE